MCCPDRCKPLWLVPACLAILTFGPMAFTARAGSTPYAVDDFEDGSQSDAAPFTWLPGGAPGGSRAVVGGDYVVSSSGLASSYVSESSGLFRPITVATQLRIVTAQANRGFGGIFVVSPSLASYWGGIDAAGKLYLGESTVDGHSPIPLTAQSPLQPSNQDVLLELSAVGDQVGLTAWLAGESKPSSPQLTYIDPSPIASGTFGVLVDGQGSQTSVNYRWFSAVPEPTGGTALVLLGATAWLRKRLRRWRPVATVREQSSGELPSPCPTAKETARTA